MATIQTATRPIEGADLGFTFMHEHVRVGWGPRYVQHPARSIVADRSKSLTEMATW